MIIRCRKCETRFRFDDQLMTGEGAWVRCSRCQNVFFQDNPSWAATVGRPAESDNRAAAPGVEETMAAAQPIQESQQGNAGIPYQQGSDTRLLARMKGIQNAIDDAAEPRSSVKEFDDDDMVSVEGEGEPQPRKAGWMPSPDVKKKRSPVLRAIAYIFLVLLLNIVAAGLYIGFFPDGRQQVADVLSPYFPWAENLGGPSSPVWSQVVVQDVRQHFVNNWLMGNLRVVEGSVVNKSKYPLTRLQVRGRLYDQAGNAIGEWISFCGKILTDAELATLSESQLKQMLSGPPVGAEISDRINPNGQIPFMVVMAHHDQQAVVKTTVMVSGAEKLLE